MRKCYKPKPNSVTAVQIDLDLIALNYRKWGAEQAAKAKDWLVNNNGEVYTVDNEYFLRFYQKISPGVYAKTENVWAEVANDTGFVKTLEGKSKYAAGDYLVYDAASGGEAYTVNKTQFEKMYCEVVNP